jgi:hypothetical protein
MGPVELVSRPQLPAILMIHQAWARAAEKIFAPRRLQSRKCAVYKQPSPPRRRQGHTRKGAIMSRLNLRSSLRVPITAHAPSPRVALAPAASRMKPRSALVSEWSKSPIDATEANASERTEGSRESA